MNKRIVWTEERLRYIREHYPVEPAHEIADVIGCSEGTITLKARQLGIRKSPSFRKSDYVGRYSWRRKGNKQQEGDSHGREEES